MGPYHRNDEGKSNRIHVQKRRQKELLAGQIDAERYGRIMALAEIMKRIGPKRIGPPTSYWPYMTLEAKKKVVAAAIEKNMKTLVTKDEAQLSIERLLGLNASEEVERIIKLQKSYDKDVVKEIADAKERDEQVDEEKKIFSATLAHIKELVGKPAAGDLKTVYKAIYDKAGKNGITKMDVIKEHREFYLKLLAIVGAQENNVRLDEEKAMIKLVDYLMKRDAASLKLELYEEKKQKPEEEALKNLKALFAGTEEEKPKEDKEKAELKKREDAARESIKEAFANVAEGMTGDVLTSKREWRLAKNEINAFSMDDSESPLKIFLNKAGNDVIVFGGAVRNALLRKEKDTEEFDIMIRADLTPEDRQDIAKQISEILLGDKAPADINIDQLKGIVNRMKPGMPEYSRVIEIIMLKLQGLKTKKDGDLPLEPRFKDRLAQHMRSASIDMLLGEEDGDGVTKENLMAVALYRYLLYEAKSKKLLDHAVKKLRSRAVDLGVNPSEIENKGEKIILDTAKFDGRLLSFSGVVDEEGRIYTVYGNEKAFNEIPELTINRLAVEVGTDRKLILHDQYGGEKDLKEKLLRLTFTDGIKDDVGFMIIFRVLRFIRQYEEAGFNPTGDLSELLKDFFKNLDDYAVGKEWKAWKESANSAAPSGPAQAGSGAKAGKYGGGAAQSSAAPAVKPAAGPAPVAVKGGAYAAKGGKVAVTQAGSAEGGEAAVYDKRIIELVLKLCESAENAEEAEDFLKDMDALTFVKDSGVDIKDAERESETIEQLREEGKNVTDLRVRDLASEESSKDVIGILIDSGILTITGKGKVMVLGGGGPVPPAATGGAGKYNLGKNPPAAGEPKAPAPTTKPVATGGPAGKYGPGKGPAAQATSADGGGASASVATGDSLLRAEQKALDLLLGRAEKYDNVETPAFKPGIKAKIFSQEYIGEGYQPGSDIMKIDDAIKTGADKVIDAMIDGELAGRDIKDSDKEGVKEVIDIIRGWKPVYLKGEELWKTLTVSEYNTLNWRALEVALMMLDRDAFDKKNNEVVEDNILNNVKALDGMASPEINIEGIDSMNKIVVILGNNANGDDAAAAKELLLIQEMLADPKNENLTVYAIPKSKRIYNGMTYKDVENLLAGKDELGKSIHDPNLAKHPLASLRDEWLSPDSRFILVKDGPAAESIDLMNLAEGAADALLDADLVITATANDTDAMTGIKIPVWQINTVPSADAPKNADETLYKALMDAVHPGRRPLMTRTDEKMPGDAALSQHMAGLMSNNTPFIFGLIDMDYNNERAGRYGAETKFAGKARLVIDDIVKESAMKKRFPGVKAKHYKYGDDESAIMIEGADKDTASKVFEYIQNELMLRSEDRLGVAYFDNLTNANSALVGRINSILGTRIMKIGEKPAFIFDIIGGESPRAAWHRTLREINIQLGNNMKTQLIGHFSHYLPNFTVSIGATFGLQGMEKQSFIDDASRAVTDAKEKGRNKIEWRGEAVPISRGEITPDSTKPVVQLSQISITDPGKLNIYSLITKDKKIKDNYAVLVLKGGEFGGLEHSVRERILARLKTRYDVKTGARHTTTADEVLKRWGKNGIMPRLNKIAEEGLEGVNVAEAIGYITSGNTAGFVNWINKLTADIKAGTVKHHANIGALLFLWHYLQEDSQYLYIARKAGVSRQDVLKRYEIKKAEAKRRLGVEDINAVSEQEFVNKLLIGPAETEEAPEGALRRIIYDEMTIGALQKTITEGKTWSAPERSIKAAANGIHSAGTPEELLTDCEIMPDSDVKMFTQFMSGTAPITGPPARLSDYSTKIPTENLNQKYEPRPEAPSFDAELVINDGDPEVVRAAKEEALAIRSYLLSQRKSFLRQSIKEAIDAKGGYTFYHSLIAITRLLPYVAEQIKDDRINIYLARDGANYWLAKRMMTPPQNLEAFDKNNIVFHISREKLGAAHKMMESIINDTAQEGLPKEKFLASMLLKFQGKMAEDKTFRAIADKIYENLEKAFTEANINIKAAARFRLVESMSGGIVTGFLKTLIIYKAKQVREEKAEELNVEEFIVAPKTDDMARKRDIKTFEWPAELDLAAVKRWFTDEGLTAPADINLTAEEKTDALDQMQRSHIEAMVYSMHYPLSEVNLGHPIEFDGDTLRVSSEAKRLGAHLREMLIRSAVARKNGEVVSAITPNDISPIEDALVLPADAAFLDNLYPIPLTDDEKKAFNGIVMAHNEIFTTASDSKQAGLLKTLAEFIHVVGADTVNKIIKTEEADPLYKYQFEMFLFEMRQLSFDEFREVFTGWVFGGKDTSREDLTAKVIEADNPLEERYKIQEFITRMRRLRREPVQLLAPDKGVGGRVKRGLPLLREFAYGRDMAAIRKAAGDTAVAADGTGMAFLQQWIDRVRAESGYEASIRVPSHTDEELGDLRTQLMGQGKEAATVDIMLYAYKISRFLNMSVKDQGEEIKKYDNSFQTILRKARNGEAVFTDIATYVMPVPAANINMENMKKDARRLTEPEWLNSYLPTTSTETDSIKLLRGKVKDIERRLPPGLNILINTIVEGIKDKVDANYWKALMTDF
jgi:hypothetical protein